MMQNAARTLKFTELEQEDHFVKDFDLKLIQNNWPSVGEIDFEKVNFKYGIQQPLVLKNISFKIKQNEKIGCVGRTGSGKSSILNTLFRIFEIQKSDDSFIKIDGIDISQVGLHTLRSNISIIPQIPFTFSGTIRKNLDPLQKYSDSEIWKALEDVNLSSVVKSLKNGLYQNMSNANSILSCGQQQLICLARAILQCKKILILDEATSNIDVQTDMLIQQKIKERFQNCTVFTIAHRIITIADYDKVLVIDEGKVKEFGEPIQLLFGNFNFQINQLNNFVINNQSQSQSSEIQQNQQNLQQNFFQKQNFRKGLFADIVKHCGDSVCEEIIKIVLKKKTSQLQIQ